MAHLRVHRPADPECRRASDSPLELDQAVLAQGIRWEQIFGNAHPVELEIGCGKGLFLLQVAAAHPEVNWFGIERSSEHLRRAIDRAIKAGLENVRFAKALAEEMLGAWIPSGGLRAVHILYPDPWPKARHHKRRLLGFEKGPATMTALARVLAPGGHLAIATDHTEYAETILHVVAASPHFTREEEFYSQTLLPHSDDPLTEFERKYRKEDRPRHRFSWRRL